MNAQEPPPQSTPPDFSRYFDQHHPRPTAPTSPALGHGHLFGGKIKLRWLLVIIIVLVGVLSFLMYKNYRTSHPPVPDGFRMVAPSGQPPHIEKNHAS